MTSPAALHPHLEALQRLLDVPRELLRALCQDYAHIDDDHPFGLREIALSLIGAPGLDNVNQATWVLHEAGLVKLSDSSPAKTKE